MTALLELLRRAKETGDFQPLMSAIPYARYIGLEQAPDSEFTVKMPYQPHLIGNPALPALHGGVLGALLESAAIFQLFWESETVTLAKIITITVDYLRSAGPVETFARGVITKHGRRVVTVRASAWQDDPARPVAVANVHLLVTPSD